MDNKKNFCGCGSEIPFKVNLRYCDICRQIKKEENKQYKRDYAKMHYKEKTAKKESKAKVSITDKQQLQINKQIDSKYDTPLTEKIYKPNTAEFNRVAEELIARRSISNVNTAQHESVRFLPAQARQYVAG